MKIVCARMRWYALTALTVSYPLLVYLGIAHLQPRWLAALLALVAIVRAVATRERFWLVAAGGALALAFIAALGNQLLPLKLYPVLVSGLMMLVFLWSLLYPPSAIERVARLRHPALPATGIAYTRRVPRCGAAFLPSMVRSRFTPCSMPVPPCGPCIMASSVIC